MMKINLIFFIGLGCLLGYVLGEVIYNLGFNRIQSNPKLIYWLIIVGSMIIFAGLTAWLKKPLVIFATSFIGGYLFIKGISMYAGGFPNESQVMDYISEGEWDSVDKLFTWKVYLYLVSWVILLIIGIIVQFKINKENRSDVEDEGRNFYRAV